MNKVIDRFLTTDSEKLRIMGYTNRNTRNRIRKLNILSNCFGNPAILERIKSDWLLEELTYKGKSREVVFTMFRILADSQKEEEMEIPQGLLGRIRG